MVKSFALFVFALMGMTAVAQAQLPTMTGQPRWSSGCDSQTKDQFGDRRRSYCWLTISNSHNPGMLMDDYAYVISNVTMFEIDARGLRLIRPRQERSCENAPRRMAVDGKRIDTLTTKQQINAILSGQRLVWERQSGWPYCNIAANGTYLGGVREAVEELREKWSAIQP